MMAEVFPTKVEAVAFLDALAGEVAVVQAPDRKSSALPMYICFDWAVGEALSIIEEAMEKIAPVAWGRDKQSTGCDTVSKP